MARQTRQQRRARRAQQAETAPAGRPPAPPRVRPVANGDAQPERRPAAAPRAARRTPGSGFVHFVQEAIAELKKVEWPDQRAVISGTVVVLVACVIVGAWLWANDKVWQYVVQHVLLR
jgi:preprotein translocase SecE subunit